MHRIVAAHNASRIAHKLHCVEGLSRHGRARGRRGRPCAEIELVPTGIVLAGKLGTLDPFHPANRHDVRAVGQERRRLVGLLSSPRPTAATSARCSGMRDQPVQHVARPGRIGDDAIDRAVLLDRKRIRAAADVPLV